MYFKLFLLNIGRVLHFNTVSSSDMQMIWAYADTVTVCSSKEWCKYLYGLIRVYADSDTVCSSKEQWKCKYGL